MYSVFHVIGYFIYVLGSMDVCLLYTILCVYVMYIFCACIHVYVYREGICVVDDFQVHYCFGFWFCTTLR